MELDETPIDIKHLWIYYDFSYSDEHQHKLLVQFHNEF